LMTGGKIQLNRMQRAGGEAERENLMKVCGLAGKNKSSRNLRTLRRRSDRRGKKGRPSGPKIRAPSDTKDKPLIKGPERSGLRKKGPKKQWGKKEIRKGGQGPSQRCALELFCSPRLAAAESASWGVKTESPKPEGSLRDL